MSPTPVPFQPVRAWGMLDSSGCLVTDGVTGAPWLFDRAGGANGVQVVVIPLAMWHTLRPKADD